MGMFYTIATLVVAILAIVILIFKKELPYRLWLSGFFICLLLPSVLWLSLDSFYILHDLLDKYEIDIYLILHSIRSILDILAMLFLLRFIMLYKSNFALR